MYPSKNRIRVRHWLGSRHNLALLGGCSRMRSSFGDRTFAAAGPQIWHSLPPNLRLSGLSYGQFRQLLKTFFIWIVRQWGHGAVWTVLTAPNRNILTCITPARRCRDHDERPCSTSTTRSDDCFSLDKRVSIVCKTCFFCLPWIDVCCVAGGQLQLGPGLRTKERHTRVTASI